MITLVFGDQRYRISVDDQLKSLTGAESIMVEDYVGGWPNFQAPHNMTRSLIVLIWLAKRSAGEQATFDEIAETPGLVFGGVVDMVDDEGEPVDPMVDPGRPLAEPNGSNGSTGGSIGSEATPETSASSGLPASAASTG